jgi:hypothetical protein
MPMDSETTHDATLVSSLDDLEASLPQLIEDHDNEVCDFWCAFSPSADAILETAAGADYAYASGRIDWMLRTAGMVPDEEAQPVRDDGQDSV